MLKVMSSPERTSCPTVIKRSTRSALHPAYISLAAQQKPDEKKQFTRCDLQLGLVAGLGRAHVLHQAAVEAGVGLCGVADHQGSAGHLDQPGAQLQRLAVLFPPREGNQIEIDLARHHLAAPEMHGGRRRLAGEPGHAWKEKTTVSLAKTSNKNEKK